MSGEEAGARGTSGGAVNMKRKLVTLLVLVLSGIVIGLPAGIIFRGTFAQFVIVVFGSMYVAPALAAIALVSGFLSFAFAPNVLRWTATITLGLALVLFLQFPFAMLGEVVQDREMRAAKQYCEDLVPSLESYKERHGAYPASLAELSPISGQSLPGLLRGHTFYAREGDGFVFGFQVIDDPMLTTTYYYPSQTRQWEEHGWWEHSSPH